MQLRIKEPGASFMVKLNIVEKKIYEDTYTCIDSNLYIIFSPCLYFFEITKLLFLTWNIDSFENHRRRKMADRKKLNKFLRIRGRKRKKCGSGCWLRWITELIFCYNLIHWKSAKGGEKNCILCSFINFAMKMQNYKSKLWHKSVGWSDSRGRRENWKFYLWIHGTRCDKLILGSLLTSLLSSPAGDWGENRWIPTFPKDICT